MENYSTLSRDKTFFKRSLKTFLAIVVSIGILYLILISVESKFGAKEPSGDSGSSFSTVSSGARAWSDLLSLNGYNVKRDVGRIDLPEINTAYDYYYEDELNLYRNTSTVVILNGALPEDEAKEVKEFVEKGGRLITDNPNLLDHVLDKKHTIFLDGTRKLRATNVLGIEGVSTVEGSGIGSMVFNETYDAEYLLVPRNNENSSASAALFRVGTGDVVALPDTGMVSNSLLGKSDNALFSLKIAGSPESTVVFGEGVHGYKEINGFQGLPRNAQAGLVGIFAALTVYVCSIGRRFGVGEEPHRDLGPRRINYAHAMSNILKKSRPSGPPSKDKS